MNLLDATVRAGQMLEHLSQVNQVHASIFKRHWLAAHGDLVSFNPSLSADGHSSIGDFYTDDRSPRNAC